MNKLARTTFYSIIVSIVLCCGFSSTAFSLCGDVSGDGLIMSNDVLMVARASIGTLTLSADQIARADVSISGLPDGAIMSNDLLMVARSSVRVASLLCNETTGSVALRAAFDAASSSAALSWTQSAAADFESYKLYMSTSPGVDQSSTLVQTIAARTTTSTTAWGLSPSTGYYFVVYVCSTSSQCVASNQVYFATTPMVYSGNISGKWTSVNPKPTPNTIKAAFFVNNQTGYIVGLNGLIMKTTGGGATWTAQNSGTTNDLYGVTFPLKDNTGVRGW